MLAPAGARRSHRHDMHIPLGLTTAPHLLDIETEWTLNARLTRLSSYRKCSKRRTLGHSAQATSLLPIAGTTKSSHIVRGFSFGNGMGSAADLKSRARLARIATIDTGFAAASPALGKKCWIVPAPS
jgi:hypothetical protein